jgi:hypothetical protein
MINKTLLIRGPQWNEFTRELAAQCENNKAKLVKMRNGLLVEVVYMPEVENESREGFRNKEHTRIWDIDGRSITSTDFDLIEF